MYVHDNNNNNSATIAVYAA